MNEQKAPNVRRFAVMIGLFLLLTLALLFWAREVIREVIVLPLSYLFWVIGIIIDSTPQIFFWLALMVITFLIASRSLSRKRTKIGVWPPGYTVPDEPSSTGRVDYWMGKVNLLRGRQGGYYSRSFHGALGRMLLDLLAYRYRLGPRQVEQAVREGTLDIPEDIRAYVLESMRPPEPAGRGFFAELINSIVEALRGWFDQIRDGNRRRMSRHTKAEIEEGEWQPGIRMEERINREDPRVKRVVNYIKEELEVPHDESGR